MEPMACSETSVINYLYSLRNIPEERNSHLLRGGSLKSHNITLSLDATSCSSRVTYQRFGQTYCLYLQVKNGIN